MSFIIEESENLKLERIATVQTNRGKEYIINIDKAVCALADLMCDYENERHFGWDLETPWFEDQLRTLRAVSDGTPQPNGGA